jgi:hypothetical protein
MFADIVQVTILLGVVTMAVLQLLKDLFRTRFLFQRLLVRSWLKSQVARARNWHSNWLNMNDAERNKKRPSSIPSSAPFLRAEQKWIEAELVNPLHDKSLPNYDAIKAREQLIELATSGSPNALYELSSEQLCGQLSSAARIAADYPNRYFSFFTALAAEADTPDIALLLFPHPSVRMTHEKQSETETPEVSAYLDARNRVDHHIQRAIDGLQIRLGTQWKLSLQIASLCVGIVLAFLAVARFGYVSVNPYNQTGWVFAIGLFAGFLAPIMRDIVAVLEKFRK